MALVTNPPGVRFVHTQEDTVLECRSITTHVTVYLTYNLVLLLMITVLAFKTRKYPKNFNEAKYIGVSAYLSCSVWIIIFPCYLNMEDSFVKTYLASTSLLLVATIILGGLLVPKIFLVRRKASAKNSSFGISSVSGVERYTTQDSQSTTVV